jgi:hypothetical protein
MGIINNQGVFIAPPLGEGEGTTITSFRDDDDFSTDLFDESIVLPSFPNNVGIAFVRSSDSPADYATIALKGTNTSTIYADNTAGNLNFVVSGDTFIGYDQSDNLSLVRASFGDYIPSLTQGDLFVNGRIYTNEWTFSNARLTGKTRFGLNTIEINSDDNSINGVGIITANVGVITAISGITTITPTTNLNVNGGLIVSGVSTVGIASTSNLTEDSTFTFELTSNTNLRINVRGTDGVIRSANLTLS